MAEKEWELHRITFFMNTPGRKISQATVHGVKKECGGEWRKTQQDGKNVLTAGIRSNIRQWEDSAW